MTGRLALGLLLAMIAAACGSAPASPSVAPTPGSSWDPRRDEIDQAEAIWTAEQPATYAYTSTNGVEGMGHAVSRVTAIDGHIEVLDRATSSFVANAATVEGMFDSARAGLETGATVEVAVNQQYGYLSSLEVRTAATDGGSTQTVADLTTPGDRTAKARASDALGQLLDRWAGVVTPAWEYSWTRVEAASPDAPAGWVVRRASGRTTALAAAGGAEVPPPEKATIAGAVADALGVIGRGGWVDVSADNLTGLDVLLAIDPSPAVAGDGYWIRIDFTDKAAASQRDLLAAARARWADARLKRYSYTWAYTGDGGAWSWTVRMSGSTLKLQKKSAGAPAVDATCSPPRIRETFDLIDEVIQGGGSVLVTYDKALGYPKKIVIGDGGAWAPKGTVTIKGFKTP